MLVRAVASVHAEELAEQASAAPFSVGGRHLRRWPSELCNAPLDGTAGSLANCGRPMRWHHPWGESL